MHFALIDFLLAAGAVVTAIAVACIGAIGLVVWVAGGRPGQRRDRADHR